MESIPKGRLKGYEVALYLVSLVRDFRHPSLKDHSYLFPCPLYVSFACIPYLVSFVCIPSLQGIQSFSEGL